MKPLQHARITAHRYGGEWQDWIAVHNWVDRSKMVFPSVQHRIFLHSDFGEWLAEQVWGTSVQASDGTVVATRDLFRDHQTEDLGRVVSLIEWLNEVDRPYWLRRQRSPRYLEPVREEPLAGLAARWGGSPDDYHSLVAFFDQARQFAPEQAEIADLITHNSFGIFLAEELFGCALYPSQNDHTAAAPPLISTRSVAEDLVYARIGSIPPAGHLAAHVRLKLWMRGTGVYPALRQRLAFERQKNQCGRQRRA
jgi:hypothetical protein